MSEEDFLAAFVTLEQVVKLQHFVNQILLLECARALCELSDAE